MRKIATGSADDVKQKAKNEQPGVKRGQAVNLSYERRVDGVCRIHKSDNARKMCRWCQSIQCLTPQPKSMSREAVLVQWRAAEHSKHVCCTGWLNHTTPNSLSSQSSCRFLEIDPKNRYTCCIHPCRPTTRCGIYFCFFRPICLFLCFVLEIGVLGDTDVSAIDQT